MNISETSESVAWLLCICPNMQLSNTGDAKYFHPPYAQKLVQDWIAMNWTTRSPTEFVWGFDIWKSGSSMTSVTQEKWEVWGSPPLKRLQYVVETGIQEFLPG